MASNAPYDATTRVLLSTHPQDWLAFLGMPDDVPVELLDTDLSTVSAQADGVLRVGGNNPEIVHIEFESGNTGSALAGRLLRYNVLLGDVLRLPVRSVAVLLSSGSDSPRLTGTLTRTRPDGVPYLTFGYDVVRVWRIPAERFLTGGLSLLPLAPIAQGDETGLSQVIDRINDRIEAATQNNTLTPDAAAELWTATYVMMGVKYDSSLSKRLMQGIMQMTNSTTYQEIVREGLAKGMAQGIAQGRGEAASEARDTFRLLIRRVGDKRFGTPPASVIAALNAVESVAELEAIAERLFDGASWDAVLQTP